MKCWINHNKLKHYLLRNGGVQLFVTCGISSIPPIFLPPPFSPILTPHWQMNLFFLPCESIKIRILVILEATYPKVSLTEKKLSVLHAGIPHIAPGMCHCHPAFTSSCHGHGQGLTSLFFFYQSKVKRAHEILSTFKLPSGTVLVEVPLTLVIHSFWKLLGL